MTTADVAAVLARVTGALPGGGEARPGQVAMAEAVARAVDTERHLVVQAGTGTGKSLAYLVPALLSGQKVVVATATKALQDQLAGKDLPSLGDHLGREVSWAVLKGRSNYVCRQRIREVSSGDHQLALDGLADRAPRHQLRRLAAWAEVSPTGDRAELDFEPSPAAWAAVSVSSLECPGAARCPQGGDCFAEGARQRAADADVVVVNTHLYGLHLECGGTILPDHDVVVIDEAHSFEDTISATFGLEVGAGRFQNLARSVGGILDDPTTVDATEVAGLALASALVPHVGRRLKGRLDDDLAAALVTARERLSAVLSALRAVTPPDIGDVTARRDRAVKLTGSLIDELDAVLTVPSSSVAWVEGPGHDPSLRVAPIDVADLLREVLWPSATVVLTSATIPSMLAVKLGIPDGGYDQLDAGSPFDYPANGLLYCASGLPDPTSSRFEAAMHDELVALIDAAGGRTLALFTSFRAMDAAVDTLRARLRWPVLSQRDLPKPALVEAFAADQHTVLAATMGFWQGIDVPGPSLSLVTIDRLPFPRPDEPLLQARREKARQDAFRVVDLPRAATMLAQGAGRLIRTAHDRGVVAVLDPRLATRRQYRWDIVNALPPMRRTGDRAEAEVLLRALAADADADESTGAVARTAGARAPAGEPVATTSPIGGA